MSIVLPTWHPLLPRVREINRIGTDGVTHRVTIIVPTRNAVDNLRPVLELAAAYADELLVVDGHSTDGACELAAACGARVILDEGKGASFFSILLGAVTLWATYQTLALLIAAPVP